MNEPPEFSADWYQNEANLYALRAKAEAKSNGPKAPTYASLASAFAQIAVSMRLAELLGK